MSTFQPNPAVSSELDNSRMISPTKELPLQGLRVVVIDDQHAVLTSLARRFKATGAIVTPLLQEPGQGLAEMVEKIFAVAPAPHLVMTDFNMPEFNGAELVAACRARLEGSSRANQLAVIGTSSATAVASDYAKAGALTFLDKTYQIEDLVLTLRHLAGFPMPGVSLEDLQVTPRKGAWHERFVGSGGVAFLYDKREAAAAVAKAAAAAWTGAGGFGANALADPDKLAYIPRLLGAAGMLRVIETPQGGLYALEQGSVVPGNPAQLLGFDGQPLATA